VRRFRCASASGCGRDVPSGLPEERCYAGERCCPGQRIVVLRFEVDSRSRETSLAAFSPGLLFPRRRSRPIRAATCQRSASERHARAVTPLLLKPPVYSSSPMLLPCVLESSSNAREPWSLAAKADYGPSSNVAQIGHSCQATACSSTFIMVLFSVARSPLERIAQRLPEPPPVRAPRSAERALATNVFCYCMPLPGALEIPRESREKTASLIRMFHRCERTTKGSVHSARSVRMLGPMRLRAQRVPLFFRRGYSRRYSRARGISPSQGA